MSIEIMSMVWKASNEFLTSSEKTVLVRLADFAADDGYRVYPSWNRIIRDTGISRSSVARSFSSLQKKGVLIKMQEASKEEWHSCIYRINKPLLESWKENKEPTADSRCHDDTPLVSPRHPLVSERDYPSVTTTRDPSVTPTPQPSYTNHHINHHKREDDVVVSPPLILVSQGKEKEKVLSKKRPKTVVHMADTWNATVAISGAVKVRLDMMIPSVEKMALAAYAKLQEDGWQEFLGIVASTPFLNGENERAFRVTFAWVLKPVNLMKIMEGFYSSQLTAKDINAQMSAETARAYKAHKERMEDEDY